MAFRAREASKLIKSISRSLLRGVDGAVLKAGACPESAKPPAARLTTLSRTKSPLEDCLDHRQAQGAAAQRPPSDQPFSRASQCLVGCRSSQVQRNWAFGEGRGSRALSARPEGQAKESTAGGGEEAGEEKSTGGQAGSDEGKAGGAGSTEGEGKGEGPSEEGGGAGGSGDAQGKEGGAWAKYGSWFKAAGNGPNSAESAQARLAKVGQFVWKEVKEAVLPREELLSPTRAREGTVSYADAGKDGPSQLLVTKKKKPYFRKLLEDAFQSNPFFRRLRGLKDHQVITKGREFAEDLKDRWETSDHPMMHRIQDVQDRLFTEPEAARVMREIRLRDPSFDMVGFLRSVKADIPVIITAYLEGNEPVLKQHCTQEMTERLIGMFKHYEAQGSRQDPTLLFVSDVELFDATYVEQQPIIVVTFSCQQINCLRDKFGNVVDGREDEIHQVYYAWALQQDEHGAFGAGGELLPPRWQLREMMIRGFHNLL
eukprot:evm.model.scf_282EXC.7 EVM.evm.TU.scf_282EXC.7   scf_282EXC:68677-72165(-)